MPNSELFVLRCIQPSVNAILVDEQYGFRPIRSATTQFVFNLIVFYNFKLEAIEKRTWVNVIFTDFSKAFDRIDHKILIEVLYKTGFGSLFYLDSNLIYLLVGSIMLKSYDINLKQFVYLQVFFKRGTYPRCYFLYWLMV
ncbi:uncharacterized protein LOC113548209 [Rhopalosiphum maidis]|uniref:uncharacterized protein LOC113548209 n=1 Tax=Rhopalosiphum maidis TaxID=43146 RepID=UPI000EFEA027|nr:uncharacterized protein LOC113548209 [Rhopalosiphum maidis]